MDQVACRYGWHDDQILEMRFDRFMTAVKAARESELDTWRIAAFVGWQSLNAAGASDKSFSEYLRMMGLGIGTAQKVDSSKAIERARQIAASDAKRGVK